LVSVLFSQKKELTPIISVGYRGPIVLECIRQIRQNPSRFMPEVLAEFAKIKTADHSD